MAGGAVADSVKMALGDGWADCERRPHLGPSVLCSVTHHQLCLQLQLVVTLEAGQDFFLSLFLFFSRPLFVKGKEAQPERIWCGQGVALAQAVPALDPATLDLPGYPAIGPTRPGSPSIS